MLGGVALFCMAAAAARVWRQALWFACGLAAATAGIAGAGGYDIAGAFRMAMPVWVVYMVASNVHSRAHIQTPVFFAGLAAACVSNYLVLDCKVAAAAVVPLVALGLYGIAKVAMRDYERA